MWIRRTCCESPVREYRSVWTSRAAGLGAIGKWDRSDLSWSWGACGGIECSFVYPLICVEQAP